MSRMNETSVIQVEVYAEDADEAFGGKSRLAKRIGAAILENTNQRGQYIEPMIGGGSVFTDKLFVYGKGYK